MTLPHAESAEYTECFFVNTNHANFTKDYNGSVGSRHGATEWIPRKYNRLVINTAY